MEIIRLKIDVTKIDKARLFAGKKGTYLDLVVMPTRESRYGDDYIVKQSCSAEESKAGVKLPIIGNGRIVATAARQKQALSQAKEAAAEVPAETRKQLDEDSSVPF